MSGFWSSPAAREAAITTAGAAVVFPLVRLLMNYLWDGEALSLTQINLWASTAAFIILFGAMQLGLAYRKYRRSGRDHD